MAIKCKDGSCEVLINSPERGNRAYRNRWHPSSKKCLTVHGVDKAGKAELAPPDVPRANLLELVAHVPPCLIGMEACSGVHHWARKFAEVRPHGALDGTEVRRSLSHQRPSVAKTTRPMQPPCIRHSSADLPPPVVPLIKMKSGVCKVN